MGGFKVVLTSDRATMTDYGGFEGLGFILCLPSRLLPRFFAYRVLAPPIETDADGRALVAPLPLRKLEASLLEYGFSKDEVAITTPEKLAKTVSGETKVVGIHVLDPMGLAPVSHSLSAFTGGGETYTKTMFLEFAHRLLNLKRRYGFRVVAGGPGTWQLKGVFRSLGIDHLFHGEGEAVFPQVCQALMKGESLPSEIEGKAVPEGEIPLIRGPTRCGVVQITRGCPRRCRFCNPTMFKFRSIPLDDILREVEINVRGGESWISLATEDGFLYGARGIEINRKAVRKLISEVSRRVARVGFCHVSISSIVQAPDLVQYFSETLGYNPGSPYLPQIGLETGSPRLIERYMSGKPRPWKPSDWPNLAVEASQIMNEWGWYPCYTLIVGLPGENDNDILQTLELVDRLKHVRCWLFPLLMVPMGGSLMENENFYQLESFNEARWELVYRCLRHSLSFSKHVYRGLVKSIRSVLARYLVQKFFEYGMKVIEDFLEASKRNPVESLTTVSAVNFQRNPISQLAYLGKAVEIFTRRAA